LRLRLDAVEVLAAFKDIYSYEGLSSILGIHPSILCRYYQGDTVPSNVYTKRILDTLLSKDFIKEFIYKSLSKYNWSYSRVLSDPKVLNLLSLYISNRILSSLAGSGLKSLITFPGISSFISSLTATRLDLPVIVLYDTSSKTSIDTTIDFYDLGILRKGDYIAVIVDVLTSERLNILSNFLRDHELVLKILMCIILADKDLEKVISSMTLFEYLIP